MPRLLLLMLMLELLVDDMESAGMRVAADSNADVEACAVILLNAETPKLTLTADTTVAVAAVTALVAVAVALEAESARCLSAAVVGRSSDEDDIRTQRKALDAGHG